MEKLLCSELFWGLLMGDLLLLMVVGGLSFYVGDKFGGSIAWLILNILVLLIFGVIELSKYLPTLFC